MSHPELQFDGAAPAAYAYALYLQAEGHADHRAPPPSDDDSDASGRRSDAATLRASPLPFGFAALGGLAEFDEEMDAGGELSAHELCMELEQRGVRVGEL